MRQIGSHADGLPAAADVEPQAAADVVEHQHRARLVAHPTKLPREVGPDVLVGQALDVSERRDDDRREVVARPGHGGGQTRGVVVLEVVDRGPIAGEHTRRVGGAPRRGAVIAAAGEQHHARPVAALAIVTQAVVASVPFFARIAQSA